MRVWDIHPGYLSRQNLLGQHAEIHALVSIITGQKKGYAAHPETLRWKGYPGRLKRIHDLTVLEMKLRGFNHHSPCQKGAFPDPMSEPAKVPSYIDTPYEQIRILEQKNRDNSRRGRIPLPRNDFEFWAHHKYSVMARGYQYYKDIQMQMRQKKSHYFNKTDALIALIMAVMENPVTLPALANVIDHIWGYFKREASGQEKEIYLNRRLDELPTLIPYLYSLALRYNKTYLLLATVFADFTKHPSNKF